MERERILEDPARVTPDDFPRLRNFSAAFLYEEGLARRIPERPEYVTVPMRRSSNVKLKLAVSEWNILWEAAQFRRRMFDHRELPARLERLAERGDVNMHSCPAPAPGTTSTRRCTTCSPWRPWIGSGCRSWAAGSGCSWWSVVMSTGSFPMTSRPGSGVRGRARSGVTSCPARGWPSSRGRTRPGSWPTTSTSGCPPSAR